MRADARHQEATRGCALNLRNRVRVECTEITVAFPTRPTGAVAPGTGLSGGVAETEDVCVETIAPLPDVSMSHVLFVCSKLGGSRKVARPICISVSAFPPENTNPLLTGITFIPKG